jgi:hypothetical protein
LNFLRYIDASHPTCPKCGSIIKVSWGWCPYHGTRKNFPDLFDLNNDGDMSEEFYRKNGSYSINNFKDRKLIVHWTEFII